MIVNVVLNFIFIPAYGIVGSAVATLVSYTVAVFSIGIDKRAGKQFLMMVKSVFMITTINYIFEKWKSH